MASIIFGTYVPSELDDFPDNSDPNIIDVEWLDEKEKPIGTKTINGAEFSDIMYGEKVRVKVKFENTPDNRRFFISITTSDKESRGYTAPIPLLQVKNNEALSEPFYLPITLYRDEIEEYDYNNHYTKVVKPQELYVTVAVRTTLKSKPSQILKPYTYFRNYEELVGLFKTDNSGEKHSTDNYENQFIGYEPAIKTIVDDFITKMTDIENVFDEDGIDEQVRISSKALWNAAVASVQSGNLDDRPLYWARNKMQVYLKRHPIFKNDIDFERSLPKENTPLSRLIKVFEELSRNYTGIDSSKARGKKRILLTGFDPFLLNSIDHPYKNYYNILQSNPSGVAALILHKNSKIIADIQTLIVPVRYSDFDGSNDPSEGQGEGIIEKYIKPFINKVDLIITCSQYLPNENVIDMFATSRRGGGDENMNYERESGSKAILNSPEWIITTLPNTFENDQGVKFNWSFNGSKRPSNIYPKEAEILFEGSGGNYLSNEIFFRVAKLREENLDRDGIKRKLPTGHFHVAKIQDVGCDLDMKEMKKLMDIIIFTIEEGLRGI